jgi:hypothetical protein
MRAASTDIGGAVGPTREAARALTAEPSPASRRGRAREALLDRVREAQQRLRAAPRRT